MSATAVADPSRTVAELRRQLDELAAELQVRTAERDEALAQQSATAEILQVVNSSSGNLTPVFEAILDKALALCGAAFGVLWRYDGDAMRVAAIRGATPEYAAFLTRETHRPGAGSAHGRLLAGDPVAHLADIADSDDYRSGNPLPRALVELGGGRSLLAVALRKDAIFLGDIVIYRREVRPFTDQQIALLQNFAAQAVIAIENARLLGELRERTRDLEESLEYQTATSDVLKVISGAAFDLEPVLQTVVTTAVRLCRADQAVLYRNIDGEYRWAAGASLVPEYEHIEREVRIRPGIGTLVGRAALEARTVHILDAWTDPLYEAKADARIGGVHTMLGVPLLREGEPIGVIGLARQQVESYTEKEIELVRTFADQAVIAIENTRLLTELRESLERQQAIAEVLQVINSSPGELAPVFDAMLARAMRLCEAPLGFFLRYQDGRYSFTAGRGLNPRFAEYLSHMDQPGPNEANTRVVEGVSYLHITDLRDDDPYRSGAPFRQACVDLGGTRTGLAVPMRKENELLGTFSLARYEVRPFAEKQIELVCTFANQAVVAIENARLLDELRARTRDLEESLEYQTATSDVLKVISRSTFDLQPVLDTVCATARRLCGAGLAGIAVRKGDVYRYIATSSINPKWDAKLRETDWSPGRESVAGRVTLERRVLHIEDLAADPDYVDRGTAAIGGARTALGVPLLREGEPVGAIFLGHERVQLFTERQIELVRTFAAQAVIAIENTRLLTELRESLEQQQAIAEVLQVINSSPGDLAPVFDVMLEKALYLCEASFGMLHTHEGDIAKIVASRNLPAPYFDFMTREPLRIGPETLHGRAIASRSVIHLADISAGEPYRNRVPLAVAAVELGGVRTGAFIPLLKDEVVPGLFLLYRQEVRPFSDNQIALLQNFAAQAVIAMDNARLLQEIRQRQAELRVTFDNMGDGVAMFDAELRLAAWNRNFQQILDLPDGFVAARPSSAEFVRHLASRGEYGAVDVEAEVRRLSEAAGTQWSAERTRPDGRIIEVRHNPVPSGGFVLIYSDVTERKRAEAEIRAARDAAEKALGELKTAQASLLHAQKMAALGQLTAGIAHEIKNPLNFVNNFAGVSNELLDELKAAAAPALTALDDETRAEIDETIAMLTGNLDKITEHGRRADGIVQSMLAHSRGTSGERQKVDLNALVKESLNLAYHGARAQDQSFNITLERDLDGAAAPVELVPQDVMRVFLNLIGNGFYAAHKRAREAGGGFRPLLKVTTRDLGDAVEVKVRDNGAGIAPEHRDRLFQPFFTTKPTGEGTGLGLSISYDIVTQQHGGTITVESEVGSFTEFTVQLPRR